MNDVGFCMDEVEYHAVMLYVYLSFPVGGFYQFFVTIGMSKN
jgi:hypothetical protein